MPLFVASQSVVRQPGVFPIEVAPPTVIEGVSLGYIGYAFQSDWGAVKSLYTPSSGGDLINKFFPAGSSHATTGYYGIMRRKAFTAKLVRVLGGAEGILPPLSITITQGGTSGATAYSYQVVAKNAAGATQGSARFYTAAGNATLTGVNTNILTWPTVVGATSYDVYRVSGGAAAQGKIFSAVTGLTSTDIGGAGDAAAVPTANTTGWKGAVCILLSGTTPVARLVCVSPGTGPNTELTAQAGTASSGDAAYFDLVLTLQNSVTGSTTERFANLKCSATAVLASATNARLLGSYELIGTPTAEPTAGTYTFAGGSNGAAIVSGDYEDALDLMAVDDEIRVVVADDCGDTIRGAVNDFLVAHVAATTDRMCVLQGNQGLSLAATKTDALNFTSDRVFYEGAWANVTDDSDVAQITPFATFVATCLVNLQPQESHAWWNDKVTFYYDGIDSIYSPLFSTADGSTGGARDQCTQAGIGLPIRLENGKYASLHDRVTSNVVNTRYGVTRRIKDYLAKSIKRGITPFVNGPNVLDQWEDIKIAIDNFLAGEVRKNRLSAVDPVDIASQNNVTTQALGQFVFVCTGRTPTVMEQIFPMIAIGPSQVGITFA